MDVRAAVLVEPGKIEFRNFPYPKLNKGGAILKVEMVGICGTDKHLYSGELLLHSGFSSESKNKLFKPFIPGHEIVGKIEEISKEAKECMEFEGNNLSPGDRVVICPDLICGNCYYCKYSYPYTWCENLQGYGTTMKVKNPPYLFGGWSEYIYLLPGTKIFKVPEELPLEIAVLAENMTVSSWFDRIVNVLFISGKIFSPDVTVIIQGIGPIGLFFLIRSKIFGASKIIAIDISDYKLAFAKEFGADFIINSKKIDFDDMLKFIKGQTSGVGADIFIHCVGFPETIKDGLKMIRKGGLFLDAGTLVDKDVNINFFKDFVLKNIRFIGAVNVPINGFAESLRIMKKWKTIIPFEKIVTHRFPLLKVNDAIKKSFDPETMKVVIINQ